MQLNLLLINLALLSLTHRGGSRDGCHWSGLAGSGHRRYGSSPTNTGPGTAHGTGDTPVGGHLYNPHYTGYPSWWRFLLPSANRVCESWLTVRVSLEWQVLESTSLNNKIFGMCYDPNISVIISETKRWLSCATLWSRKPDINWNKHTFFLCLLPCQMCNECPRASVTTHNPNE